MSSNNEQEDERQKSANELVVIEIEKRNPYLNIIERNCYGFQ